MQQKGKIQVVRTPNMDAEKRYPFDAGQKKKQGELICRYCNAVYDEKHWRHFDDLNPAHIDKLTKSVCPSCHEIRGHISDGVLHIEGTFVKANQEQIQGIIANCEAKETERDVLNRVERIESNKNEITVYTAKNTLAVEIGKKLDSAHKGGKLDIRWSKDDKPVDVRWHKDI